METNNIAKDTKKQMIIIISSVILTVIITLGSTLAAFVWSDESDKNQTLVVGDFSLTISDESPSLGGTINLSNSYPIEFINGQTYTCKDESENDVQVTTEDDYIKYCTDNSPYVFSITNNGEVPSNYNIKLVNDEAAITADGCTDNLMDNSNIKINVLGDVNVTATMLSELTDGIFVSGILYPGESKTYSLNAWIKNDAPNNISGKHFHAKLELNYSQKDLEIASLSSLILGNTNKNVILDTPNFTSESTDLGLYKNANDNGTTYYYRGNVNNNYLSFADRVWRIVRINEDGSIKIISQENILNGSYDNSSECVSDITACSTTYVDKNIQTLLNDWYTNNVGNSTILDSQVVSTNFCNDTSNSGSTRLDGTLAPVFTCPVDVINSKIATITADEIVFSGSIYASGTNTLVNGSFLNNDANFITMTSATANNLFTYNSVVSSGVVNNIRPVINLKSDIVVSGTGHPTDPYIVQ